VQQWMKKNNVILRLSALMIAILLWFYVVSELNPDMDTKIRNIDIQITDVEHLTANGLVIVSGGNETADIKLRGKRDRLNILKADNIKLSASVTSINVPGTYNLSYTVVKDVDDVSVVSKSPAQITVVVDRIATKTIPVIMTFVDQQPEGYMLSNYSLAPDGVVVKGPKSQLEKIHKAIATCSLKDATMPFNTTLSYKLVDANNNEIDMADISVDDPSVLLTADVKRIKSVPFTVKYISDGIFSEDIIKAKLSPSSIMVYGDVEEINRLNSINLGTVNIKNIITSNRNSTTFDVILPNGITAYQEVDKVELSIETPNYSMRRFSVSSENFVPISGYSYADDAEIEVEVFGPTNIISRLTEKDIIVSPSYVTNNDDGVPATAVLQVSTNYTEIVVLGSYSAEISMLVASR